MARIGVNPARGKTSSYSPARVTVAILTYIPHLDGYFKHRLDVLKLALTSLIAHTKPPYDLLVFDNGSCAPVIEYLHQMRKVGDVDYLLLSSRNLGKIGAFKVLFDAAPGEIVAYADDDIFFYPGWLTAQLKILETYPKVGMVSGVPVRDASERASQSLARYIKNQPAELTVIREHRFPDAWDADWALSTGRDPESHVAVIQTKQDLILSLHGVEAYGSASHFQFVAPKHTIQQVLPSDWSGKLMGKMVDLDEAVDRLGYLRLATVERYVRHLGNALSADFLDDIRDLKLNLNAVSTSPRRSQHWLLRIPASGRVLRVVYNWIFSVLNHKA